MSVYIAGDIHRDIDQFKKTLQADFISSGDLVILLGDVGANYLCDERDDYFKGLLQNLGFTMLCVRGNHECRPENLDRYKEKKICGGIVYYEPKFPNILFAKDGEMYDILGKKFLMIGGAYSVDKAFRLQQGYAWWNDEQLSESEKDEILNKIKNEGAAPDYICTHTCPFSYQPPKEYLSPFVDQSKVDKRMEIFLDEIEKSVPYDKWFCGHWHIDETFGKVKFLYKNLEKVII